MSRRVHSPTSLSLGDLPRVWRLFPRGRFLLGFGVLCAAIQSLLFLPIGLLVARVFDDYIPDADERAIVLSAAAILALYLAGSGMSLFARRVVARQTRDAVAVLRMRVLEHVYARPRSWHDAQDRAGLHAKIVNDTDRVEVMTGQLANPALPALIVVVALAIAALVIAPLAFVALAASVPVMVVVAQVFGRRARLLAVRWRESFNRFSRGVGWGLRNVTLMKTEGAETWDLHRRRREVETLAKDGYELGIARATHHVAQGAIAAMAAVVVLVVGGITVSRGALRLGDLIAFYALVGLILRQLAELAPAIDGLAVGAISLARLEQLLEDDPAHPYRGRRRLDFRGGIALEAVSFGYEAGRTVVTDLDLRLQPGDRVAIIGPSGAGKSTIVNLIAGLYRPSHGLLLADDVPYDEVDLDRLRHSIGIALQDPILFSGSVFENIAYGREATEAEVHAALRSAGAAGFVADLPDGVRTAVGDEGVRLSGGQRQRLAIARALFREPALLVLDEPSTYLDRSTVDELMGNLESLPQVPTLLIVTHDPEVAGTMDRVLALRDGRLEPTHLPLTVASSP
ncbi:MAG: ATP-binding cassette, subfamily bacterial [Solirubrobacterales bacterium]|nr:ATP-binding cassette, subfamily bacterial [Solirubrobacterales bacterium]